MDEIVKAALKKWPNVPHCHGWLGLDARGDWYMRDDRVQALGPFPESRGSRLQHEALIAFIGRNYMADETGCWYFQNGPQRVYVELAASPWVFRAQASPQGLRITTHTGREAQVQQLWVDENGRCFLDTDLGFGLLHSLDVDVVAEAVESGRWTPQEMRFDEMPQHFGYVLSPAAVKVRSAA